MRPVAIALATLRLVVALAMALLGLPCAALLLLLTVGRPTRTARWGQLVAHVWAKLLCLALGLRPEVHGAPPPAGSFLVSNHVSHFDVLLLTALYPTSLVAKQEIRRWPLIGQLAWAVGTVFVDRSDRDKTAAVAAHMESYLAAGVTVTLFPEGTCGDGQAVLPFKRSLFAVPVALGLPTWPVALRYQEAKAAWQDDTPFLLHFFRQLGRWRVPVAVAFGEPLPATLPRRELAFAAEAKVGELFASLHP